MSQSFKKILVIVPLGGHMAEALLATQGVQGELVFATIKLPHAKSLIPSSRHYFVIDPHTSLLKYLVNGAQSTLLMLRERPDVVLSTGGGMSIACSLLAKLFGKRLIFIESGARVTTPSRTGKLMYRFADLFIVQWRPMLGFYPNAVYGGPLL